MDNSDSFADWSQQRAQRAASTLTRVVAVVGGGSACSGILWRGEWVVTSAEAVAGRDDLMLMSGAGVQRAELRAADLTTDVAVLWVAGLASEAPASAHELRAGDAVIVAGRERRGALVAFGSVRLAGPAWTSRRGGQIGQRLEFELDVDARFEGAAVTASDGSLCAMLVRGPRSVALGIPFATVERVVAAVADRGYLPQSYLGLRLQPLWLDAGTRERWGHATRSIPVVAGVEPDSPAQAAGLAPGDLLEAVNDAAVTSVDALAARVAQAVPGTHWQLDIRRGGERQRLALTLGERARPL